jgi:YVTN family beta-propeller protein
VSLSLVLRRRAVAPLALSLLALTACDDSSTGRDAGFLDGTDDDPEIGVVVNSLAKSVTLFQAGSPDTRRQIPLGASDLITPTTAAIRGRRAAVPLGGGASVAVVDLDAARVERVFTFPAGNATGVAWLDDNSVVAANLVDDYVGKFTLDQPGTVITDVVDVAPAPTAVLTVGDRLFVVSSNLDENFQPLGDGIVTVLDGATLDAVGTVTVGRNPQYAALGPDGKVYVVNSGSFGVDTEGSVSIVDPTTLAAEATVPGFGSFPVAITVDADGMAYVSSFDYGTVVWDTRTRTFVRGPDAPLCAPVQSTGTCRGAADATVSEDGTVYQAFFGTQTLPAQIFLYRGPSYELADSIGIGAGTGPISVDVQSFR